MAEGANESLLRRTDPPLSLEAISICLSIVRCFEYLLSASVFKFFTESKTLGELLCS